MAHAEALIINPEIISRNNDGTVNIVAPGTGELVTAEAVVAYRVIGGNPGKDAYEQSLRRHPTTR